MVFRCCSALLLFVCRVAAWQGPQVDLSSPSSIYPHVLIDGKEHPATWLTLHTTYLDLADMETQVLGAASAGVEIFCVCLTGDDGPSKDPAPWFTPSNPLDNRTRSFFDRIVTLVPKALFIIRFYAEEPTGFPMVQLESPNGTLVNDTVMNALSPEWVTTTATKTAALMSYLDTEYPGRILGGFPCFLHTSEWFYPGPGDWPDMYADYSKSTRARFCQGRDAASCQLPTVAERAANLPNTTLFGSPDATRLNLVLSYQVVDAIEALTSAIKGACHGRCITVVFYGYLFALADLRLAASGHLALSRLVSSPHVDAIASPYQYLPSVRNISGPLLPHGPVAAATAAGKWWVVEDDTRTSLSKPDTPLRYANTTMESIDLLRRNLLTASLSGGGLYWYDLESLGWFGQKTHPDVTTAIWGNISDCLAAVRSLPVQCAQNRSVLEQQGRNAGRGEEGEEGEKGEEVEGAARGGVLVVVDEVSAAARSLTPDASFDMRVLKEAHVSLATSGASVQFVTAGQLFDGEVVRMVKAARCVVFLNQFVASPQWRAQVDMVVKGDNRTLVWVGPAGVFSLDSTDVTSFINVSAASSLTDIPLTLLSAGPLETSLQSDTDSRVSPHWPQPLGGEVYGDAVTLEAPRLGVALTSTPNITMLGRYTHSKGEDETSMAWRTLSEHSSVFVGTPGLPAAAWHEIFVWAGAHTFLSLSDVLQGDSVVAKGCALYLHAGDGPRRSRHVVLPEPSRVALWSESRWVPVCARCSTVESPTLGAGQGCLFSVTAAA